VPTDIQAATIPHALADRDILGAAKTGSGKTLAYLLPVIDMLLRDAFADAEADAAAAAGEAKPVKVSAPEEGEDGEAPAAEPEPEEEPEPEPEPGPRAP
jgi:hypothetical protein